MALDSGLYNEICYSLLLLKDKWMNFVEVEKQELTKPSGGLKGRAYRFFNLKIEQELSDSVCKMAVQLSKDWSFLNMFLHSIRKWSDADALMQKLGERQSTALRISTLALKIDKEIRDSDYGAEFFITPHKLLSFLNDCRTKTDEFLKEDVSVVGVVEYISSLKFQVPCPDVPFWNSFVDSVRRNLQLIRDDLDGPVKNQLYILGEEIELLQKYICCVQPSLRSEYSEFAEYHFVKKFFAQVASVIVRIANQSCHFWFSRADTETATTKANVLVDLQHKIDPANPEFIRLNLRFYHALYEMGSSVGLGYFSSFILTSRGNYSLRKELTSLVTLFINSSLKNQFFRDDVHFFFAEIYALFAEAAFLHHSACQGNEVADLFPHPELLTKICILKAELVLKEQLDLSASSITLRSLERFTDDLCPQLSASLREKNLALTEVANEVESLYASLQFDSITLSRAKHLLHILLYKLVFFKTESFLVELMKKGDILVPYETDLIESLVEELNNLKPIITNPLVTNSSYEMMLFVEFEAVCRRINQFYYSFLHENDKLKTLMHLLPQLLNKVKGIMEKFKQASSEFPVSNFPKTCELGFIDFLRRNIKVLLKHKGAAQSIELVKPHLEELKRHLKSMKSFLVNFSDLDVEVGELTDLRNHIRDVAYKLEYVVELFEVKSHWQHSIWLYFLLEDIRLVSKRVCDIPGESCASKFESLQQNSCGMVLKYNISEMDEVLVDLIDEEEVIIEQLTRGSLQRHVVSIVGMPGIGKTTLAGKVYSSQIILHHFHRRAWCNVSLTYSKRELLLEILSDIYGLSDEIHRMGNEDLQAKLRQCLLKNRYLIVMDDVWDDAVWNDLENVFPNDANGSRILITSRLRDVAAKIKPDSVPYSIRLFSDEESWMLLEKKTFKGEPCPEQLLSVGKEIAQHCQGLPLAVVAIAGLLRKTEKRRDCWKRISRSLSSLIMKDPENRCMEILELSYNHLPGYLKVCFLYLGVFLEEKDISVTKLIWFWMAEGFTQETDFKSSEDVGEDYLMELINRSLVIVTKTRSNGKVKSCRLHGLLRDLCHAKAKEDFFFQLVTRNDEPYASFPVSDYDMEFHNSHQLPPVTFDSYRLSFCLKRNHFIDSRPSGLGTRSLIFSALDDSEPRCPYDISFIFNNFKLLRMLYLECINMGVSFPVEIGLMVHLRLLAVSGYVNSIPSSLANLWKLETLIVKGFRGRVILPDSIWNLSRLRHLHVNNHVAFQVSDKKSDGSSLHLDNMVSFSTPSFSCKEDTIRILRRFPNLLKLRCIFLESWDSKNNCNQFPSLKFFEHLESLKIIYHGSALRPGELNLPLSLKKLTLSSFRLPWRHISAMSRLPNLTVLKLLAGAFEGPKWEMNNEEFKELRFLKLEALNISEWNASSDHFPRLERLVVRNCKDLKGIPHDFACINTLLTIEVQWCGQSVEESAREIGDETGEIEVLITHS